MPDGLEVIAKKVGTTIVWKRKKREE